MFGGCSIVFRTFWFFHGKTPPGYLEQCRILLPLDSRALGRSSRGTLVELFLIKFYRPLVWILCYVHLTWILNKVLAAKLGVKGHFGWDNFLALLSAFLFIVIIQQAFETSGSLILDFLRMRISHYITLISKSLPQ